jgi:hypothetical protein
MKDCFGQPVFVRDLIIHPCVICGIIDINLSVVTKIEPHYIPENVDKKGYTISFTRIEDNRKISIIRYERLLKL